MQTLLSPHCLWHMDLCLLICVCSFTLHWGMKSRAAPTGLHCPHTTHRKSTEAGSWPFHGDLIATCPTLYSLLFCVLIIASKLLLISFYFPNSIWHLTLKFPAENSNYWIEIFPVIFPPRWSNLLCSSCLTAS